MGKALKTRNIVLLTLIITTILFGMGITVHAQTSSYHYVSTFYVVNDDGSVNVTYIINVTSAPTTVPIKFEGPPLIATATLPSGITVPISTNGTYASILVMVNGTLKISYITLNMTSKSGETWVLRIRSPSEAYIILPPDATPISFDVTPNVTIVDNNVAFVLPPGAHKITYVLVPMISSTTSTTAISATSTSSTTAVAGSGVSSTTKSFSTTSTKTYTSATPVSKSRNIYFISAGIIAVVIIVIAVLLARRGKGSNVNANLVLDVLDERDRSILDALKEGPKTASELMRLTGIPKTALYRRLKKLLGMNLIEEISAGNVRKYRLKE